MPNTTIQLQIDSNLKDNAEKLFNSIGLDFSSAIKLFLTQSVVQRKIPFDAVAPENFSLSGFQPSNSIQTAQTPVYQTNIQNYQNNFQQIKQNDLFEDDASIEFQEDPNAEPAMIRQKNYTNAPKLFNHQ